MSGTSDLERIGISDIAADSHNNNFFCSFYYMVSDGLSLILEFIVSNKKRTHTHTPTHIVHTGTSMWSHTIIRRRRKK